MMNKHKQLNLYIAVICACLFFFVPYSCAGGYKRPADVSEVVGVTHADGRYYFTDKPYMEEGAEQLLELGTKVIKLWFTPDSKDLYKYNSDWGFETDNLVELAQSVYYNKVFSMPFKTYILETYEFDGSGITNWLDGMTAAEKAGTEKKFYDIASYFLRTYENTGKTFVLQNWEGDNALGNYAVKNSLGELSFAGMTAVKGMRDWINARQAGVSKAREEFKKDIKSVNVVNAFEINFIDVEKDMENYSGRALALNEVVPYTSCDLYSFSSWGTQNPGVESTVTDKLKLYKEKAPSSKIYGENNIMLGEFGAQESLFKTTVLYNESSSQKQMETAKLQLEAALDFGVVYAVYWELYCNVPMNTAGIIDNTYIKNENGSGFWLIRPDGYKTHTYNYLKDMMTSSYLRDKQKVSDLNTALLFAGIAAFAAVLCLAAAKLLPKRKKVN